MAPLDLDHFLQNLSPISHIKASSTTNSKVGKSFRLLTTGHCTASSISLRHWWKAAWPSHAPNSCWSESTLRLNSAILGPVEWPTATGLFRASYGIPWYLLTLAVSGRRHTVHFVYIVQLCLEQLLELFGPVSIPFHWCGNSTPAPQDVNSKLRLCQFLPR